MLNNLHTHTWRCKHADGDAIDYARVAARQGGRVLGMADHCPLPDGRWESVRMDLSQLPDYVAAVAHARSQVPELQILQGLECEYLPEFHDFYQQVLLSDFDCDYLVAAAHYVELPSGDWVTAFGTLHDRQVLTAYVQQCQRSIDSGLFAFLAHPDLMGCSPVAWNLDFAAASRDICRLAAAAGLPLELNTYGPRKPLIPTPTGTRPMYPWRPFWEIAAAEGVSVVVNSDAHTPADVLTDAHLVNQLIAELDLPVVDVAGRLITSS